LWYVYICYITIGDKIYCGLRYQRSEGRAGILIGDPKKESKRLSFELV